MRRENKGENSPAAPLNLPTDQFGSRDKMGHFFLSICPFSFCLLFLFVFLCCSIFTFFVYFLQFILKVPEIWILNITYLSFWRHCQCQCECWCPTFATEVFSCWRTVQRENIAYISCYYGSPPPPLSQCTSTRVHPT